MQCRIHLQNLCHPNSSHSFCACLRVWMMWSFLGWDRFKFRTRVLLSLSVITPSRPLYSCNRSLTSHFYCSNQLPWSAVPYTQWKHPANHTAVFTANSYWLSTSAPPIAGFRIVSSILDKSLRSKEWQGIVIHNHCFWVSLEEIISTDFPHKWLAVIWRSPPYSIMIVRVT